MNPPGNPPEQVSDLTDELRRTAVKACPDISAFRVPDVVLGSRPATRPRTRRGISSKGGKRISSSFTGTATKKTKKRKLGKVPPVKKLIR